MNVAWTQPAAEPECGLEHFSETDYKLLKTSDLSRQEVSSDLLFFLLSHVFKETQKMGRNQKHKRESEIATKAFWYVGLMFL